MQTFVCPFFLFFFAAAAAAAANVVDISIPNFVVDFGGGCRRGFLELLLRTVLGDATVLYHPLDLLVREVNIRLRKDQTDSA